MVGGKGKGTLCCCRWEPRGGLLNLRLVVPGAFFATAQSKRETTATEAKRGPLRGPESVRPPPACGMLRQIYSVRDLPAWAEAPGAVLAKFPIGGVLALQHIRRHKCIVLPALCILCPSWSHKHRLLKEVPRVLKQRRYPTRGSCDGPRLPQSRSIRAAALARAYLPPGSGRIPRGEGTGKRSGPVREAPPHAFRILPNGSNIVGLARRARRGARLTLF